MKVVLLVVQSLCWGAIAAGCILLGWKLLALMLLVPKGWRVASAVAFGLWVAIGGILDYWVDTLSVERRNRFMLREGYGTPRRPTAPPVIDVAPLSVR